MTAPFEIDAIASAAFAALGSGRQVAPFSFRVGDFTLHDAYRATDAVRRLREARGERVVGRKIGFTNRTIWAEYGVYAPIWGFVYDRTVRDLADIGDPFFLSGLAEPRIEPEIVFGLSRAPELDMDEAALLTCVDWAAHGFELVQSIFPGWKFAAADTVAAYGLHGALLIGERHPVAPRRVPPAGYAVRLHDRSPPRWRVGRPRACGQRARRPAVGLAPSCRAAGARPG